MEIPGSIDSPTTPLPPRDNPANTKKSSFSAWGSGIISSIRTALGCISACFRFSSATTRQARREKEKRQKSVILENIIEKPLIETISKKVEVVINQEVGIQKIEDAMELKKIMTLMKKNVRALIEKK